MKIEDITKAIEYKQGHFNMVQYILKEKPEWSISVYAKETGEFSPASSLIQFRDIYIKQLD